MLTQRIRGKIEFYFKNYEATKALGAEELARLSEYAESGLAVRFDGFKGMGGTISNPTESAYFKYRSRLENYHWAKVVENTFAKFKHEAEYEVMRKRYIEHIHYKKLFEGGFNESTYWLWRERWLLEAYMWALDYELLRFCEQKMPFTPHIKE